jgi:uncharacterized protein (DUF2141 family)
VKLVVWGAVVWLVISRAAAVSADAPVLIAVHVHGVRSDAGDLVAVLYGDNPDHFLKKGKRLARERVRARSGSVTVHLPAPRAGTYAVAVYHDENGNRKLDTSILGVPAEGFGLSNNPAVRFGVPRLADAAFVVDGARAAVDVALRY